MSLPIDIEDPLIKYSITYIIKIKINDDESFESGEIHEKSLILNDVLINDGKNHPLDKK